MPEYIEREAAIEAAKHAWSKGLEPTQYIELIPAADVAPVVHGQWIFKEDLVKWGFPYLCTACNKAHNCQEKFCPNCGVKMDMKS